MAAKSTGMDVEQNYATVALCICGACHTVQTAQTKGLHGPKFLDQFALKVVKRI